MVNGSPQAGPCSPRPSAGPQAPRSCRDSLRQRISDNLATAGIQDGREGTESCCNADAGEVRDRNSVRVIRNDVAVKVREDWRIVPAVGRSDKAPAGLDAKSRRPHQPCYPLVISYKSVATEFLGHAAVICLRERVIRLARQSRAPEQLHFLTPTAFHDTKLDVKVQPFGDRRCPDYAAIGGLDLDDDGQRPRSGLSRPPASTVSKKRPPRRMIARHDASMAVSLRKSTRPCSIITISDLAKRTTRVKALRRVHRSS